MGKLRENGWKSSKTQRELRENDVENSVRTLHGKIFTIATAIETVLRTNT